MGPVPPLILYNTTFADTSLRFDMKVLYKCYKRTSADALSQVEPKHIMYLIFRLGSSRSKGKQGLRQSSAYSLYKTLQMVYQLDTKRQLGKPINNEINAVSKHHPKEYGYHPAAAIRYCLSSPQTCVSICMLIGC